MSSWNSNSNKPQSRHTAVYNLKFVYVTYTQIFLKVVSYFEILCNFPVAFSQSVFLSVLVPQNILAKKLPLANRFGKSYFLYLVLVSLSMLADRTHWGVLRQRNQFYFFNPVCSESTWTNTMFFIVLSNIFFQEVIL